MSNRRDPAFFVAMGLVVVLALFAAVMVTTAEGQVLYYAKTTAARPDENGVLKVYREVFIYEFSDSLVSPTTGQKLKATPDEADKLASFISDSTFVALSVEEYRYATADTQWVEDGITYKSKKEGAFEAVRIWGLKKVAGAGQSTQFVEDATVDQKLTPAKDATAQKTRYTTYKADIDSMMGDLTLEVQVPFKPK